LYLEQRQKAEAALDSERKAVQFTLYSMNRLLAPYNKELPKIPGALQARIETNEISAYVAGQILDAHPNDPDVAWQTAELGIEPANVQRLLRHYPLSKTRYDTVISQLQALVAR